MEIVVEIKLITSCLMTDLTNRQAAIIKKDIERLTRELVEAELREKRESELGDKTKAADLIHELTCQLNHDYHDEHDWSCDWLFGTWTDPKLSHSRRLALKQVDYIVKNAKLNEYELVKILAAIKASTTNVKVIDG